MASLLFHGSNDGRFFAYAADTGKALWSIPLAPGFANPITYVLDGVQYVTVATGRSGFRRRGVSTPSRSTPKARFHR